MSREIKFRGKRVDNGEWVYGLLINEGRKIQCPQEIAPNPPTRLHRAEYAIDPATVGQATGLKDKNGVMIFEGDVCTAEAFAPDVMHEIVFVDCAFCAKLPNIGYCNDMTLYMCSKYEHSSLTVIGNVTDNPELLEENQ